MTEPLIYEFSKEGRQGVSLPETDVPTTPLPQGFERETLPLPEVAEVDVVRHFVRLSQMNFAIDIGMYPLGSCTMKYNPKVNEVAARLPGFALTHPLQDEDTVQGNLALLHRLQGFLAEIGGFHSVSLQPAAGAQGEFSGIIIMRNYLYDRGETQRKKMLVPDSAHGTNPASTTMSGLEIIEIPSDERGNVDLNVLKAQLDEEVIGLMLTNPNTLGLFDENVIEINRLVHEAGGLVYGDGANLNAIMGICRPGDLGFDVMHFNLHKTFSTPHGGGGPGAGPVGVSEALAEYLPGPIVFDEEDDEGGVLYRLQTPARSIGPVKSFWGNFGVLARTYTYIRMLGASGPRRVSEAAVLSANYLESRLRDVYPVPYGNRTCMHEFVAQGILEDAPGIHTLDIAKRLIDYGFHPPTVYFPLIVPEALMIEPTETESKENLDAFADALIEIAEEARTQPDLLHSAPHTARVSRLDEVKAARDLKLRATCY